MVAGRKLSVGLLLALCLLAVMLLSMVPPLVSTMRASTTVGGAINVDTTWTVAGSPYVVANSVLVSPGVTLTIEPGVEVAFDLAKGLQVDGQLIARGTEAQRIVFTSNQGSPAPGDWVQIVLS